MTKKHCHEIEVKYEAHSNTVEKIAAVLAKLGFTFKSTAKLIDRWLPTGTRLREQKKVIRKSKNGKTKFGESKFETVNKTTIKNDGEIKSKCEDEKKISAAQAHDLLHKRGPLPTVVKIRTSWVVTIKGRDYTAVIDRVTKLGKFNGFYFELETLIPSDVEDPKAESDVKALAAKILKAAYKAYKTKPKKVLLSYRKMAMLNQAKQRRDKRAKLKSKQLKPKRARTQRAQSPHCQ